MQARQLVAPSAGWNRPAAQRGQLPAAAAAEAVPEKHAVGAVAPALDHEPAGDGSH